MPVPITAWSQTMDEMNARRRRQPYSARDMATFCNVSLDQFYRTRDLLESRGMPKPYKPVGKLAWSRERVDLWRAGVTIALPANDPLPTVQATSDAEHRDHLQRVYGSA